MASRLPTPGSDDGTWGNILNDFLNQAHNTDGSLKPLSQAQITNLTADLAAKVGNTDLDAKTAALVSNGASTTNDALKAAAVAAVEQASEVTPAGVWDFAVAPTVSGSALTGNEGPQGPPGLVWRAAWNTNASYAADDAINYNGRAFIALQASTGITPPATAVSTAYWGLLADRGEQGPAGTGAAGVISPSDLALKAWVCDPVLLNAGTRTTFVAGQLNGTLINLPADTITGASFFIGVAGVALTNCYLAVLDAATGNRLAVTADISSTLTSTGVKRVAFSAPFAAMGGPAYVVMLIGGGTTMPQAVRLPNTDSGLSNVRGPGQPAGRIRTGQITTNTGLTAVPVTNDMSGNTAQASGLWVGLD